MDSNAIEKDLRLNEFLLSTKKLSYDYWQLEQGNFSVVGIEIRLTREYQMYLLKSYLPTFVLVLMSGISFKIPGEAIPGRMTLLITIFLVLVNIANASDSKAYGYGLNGLDIWLRMCMAFVAGAIGEYSAVLSILYKDSHKVKPLSEDFQQRQQCVAAALDKKFIFIFFITFACCNAIYWPCYLL